MNGLSSSFDGSGRDTGWAAFCDVLWKGEPSDVLVAFVLRPFALTGDGSDGDMTDASGEEVSYGLTAGLHTCLGPRF